MNHRCACGHVRGGHEHLRPGTDCAFCECPRYRVDAGGMASSAVNEIRRRVARFVPFLAHVAASPPTDLDEAASDVRHR